MKTHLLEREPDTRNSGDTRTGTVSGLVDRTHVVVDLENICGNAKLVPQRAAKAFEVVSNVVSFDRAQLVVAVGISAWLKTPDLAFQWPKARILVGYGVDGADLRLVEDLLDEPQASRSARVVIVSGDGRFVDPAIELAAQGVEVTVVAQAHKLSRRLAEAATHVRHLPLIAA